MITTDASSQVSPRLHNRVVAALGRGVDWARSQDMVVRIAWFLGVLQFLVLAIEELRLAGAGALSYDYSVDAGAYGAISRGLFDPTFVVGRSLPPFLYNHYDILTWPLAFVLVVIAHLPITWTLLILLQALPLALVGPIVATYASVRARELDITGVRRTLVVLVPAVLASGDIWLYWSADFDYHDKALQGLFVVVAAIALERRRPAWLASMAVLLLLTGDTGGLVVIGLGLVALMRRRWRVGVPLVLVGAIVALAPGMIVPPLAWGGGPVLYGALAPGEHTMFGIALTLVRHPSPAIDRLTRHLPDIWALLGAAGLIGALIPEGIGMMVTVGLAAWLAPQRFSYAGLFQTVPVTDMVLLGTALGVMWMVTHWQLVVASLLSIVAVLFGLGWATVFGPRLLAGVAAIAPAGPAGSSLAALEARIPPRQEVLAPNGIIGDFAGRHQILQQLPCGDVGSVATFGAMTNFVIAPMVGAEYCSPGSEMETASELARLPGASFQELPGHVYWIRWQPGPGHEVLQIDGGVGAVCPTMLLNQPAPNSVAPQASGCEVPKSGPGFAVEGLTVSLSPRSVGEALVAISVRGDVALQVWDDPAGRLVAQRYLGSTSATEVVAVPFDTPRLVPPSRLFSNGVAPFLTRFTQPIGEDAFELRVYVPRGSRATVAGVWLGTAGQGEQVMRSAPFAGRLDVP